MKNLLIVVGVYALASFGAKAQTYGFESITPLSAAIVANTSSNTTSVLDVRRNAEFVGLQLECTPSTNFGGSSITLTFKPSVDGVTFAAAPVYTWIHAMAGGTSMATQTIATNLSIQGYGYLQLATVANSNNTNAVSVVLKYAVKNPAQ